MFTNPSQSGIEQQKFDNACRHASAKTRDAIKRFSNLPRNERIGTPLEPYILVVSGGAGTGKSTLIETLRRKKVLTGNEFCLSPHLFQSCFDLNEQDLKHRHPEKASHNIDPENDSRAKQYAAAMMDFVQYAMHQEYNYKNAKGELATGRGYPIVIDDHGDNMGLIKKIFSAARENHYPIVMAGLTCEDHYFFSQFSEGCKARGCGGETEIADNLRWALEINKKFKSNWQELSKLADTSIIYLREKCNAISTTAIFTPHSSKILDEDNYAQFQNWQQLNTSANGFDDLYFKRTREECDHHAPRVGCGGGTGRKRGADAPEDAQGKNTFLERITRTSEEVLRGL